ncbi:Rv2732c family membrane protein [Rhodococcus sp. P1Y]|uniref:Rv2732c family membrane protein n=1 Tax=Rhodococcus sp. P1Y TaxID=1302308 RepID=UPI000EB2C49A|nr:hypothetical protein [Rhodococcus sp. P1Y]AYJ49524.1 hypothetical protein D8W71_15730 [Rhodococcus sp. P1Y]
MTEKFQGSGGHEREDRATSDQVPDHQAPDYDRAEKKIDSEIDPGVRAVVVAVLVMLLLLTLALPHTGSATGFDVLSGDDAVTTDAIALPSRVFVWFVLVFAVVTSVLALVTRIWALAWIALVGSAIASVFGMLSIWSRQTLPADSIGSGPGVGLVIGWVLVAALTFQWLKAVWNKTTAQLDAQERRRAASVDAEQNSRWAGPVLGRPTDRER